MLQHGHSRRVQIAVEPAPRKAGCVGSGLWLEYCVGSGLSLDHSRILVYANYELAAHTSICANYEVTSKLLT